MTDRELVAKLTYDDPDSPTYGAVTWDDLTPIQRGILTRAYRDGSVESTTLDQGGPINACTEHQAVVLRDCGLLRAFGGTALFTRWHITDTGARLVRSNLFARIELLEKELQDAKRTIAQAEAATGALNHDLAVSQDRVWKFYDYSQILYGLLAERVSPEVREELRGRLCQPASTLGKMKSDFERCLEWELKFGLALEALDDVRQQNARLMAQLRCATEGVQS